MARLRACRLLGRLFLPLRLLCLRQQQECRLAGVGGRRKEARGEHRACQKHVGKPAHDDQPVM